MKAWEYELRFKDSFSPAMRKLNELAHRADRGFERLRQGANAASSRITSLARRGADSMNRLARSVNKADREMSQFDRTVGSLKNTFLAYLGLDVAKQFGMTAVNTRAQMEGLNNSIKFSSGAAAEAQRNMKFLDDTVKTLGLESVSTKEGFAKVLGAFRDTKLEGKATRDIFGGVAIAASAMNLKSDETGRVFKALSDIMSKGTVQAEEIKGQLGDALPGAFQIAARAMGMSSTELGKFMADGKLLAEDFLPRFAAQLRKEFSGALPESVNSLTASMNRGRSAMTDLYDFIGGKMAPYVKILTDRFITFTEWVKTNWDTIVGYGKAIMEVVMYYAAFKTAIIVATGVGQGYLMFLHAARVATLLWHKGTLLLNMAMRANPIGLVATAIGVLITLITIAYNKFDWFRGGVWGLWEAFKQVFKNIGDMAKNIFGGIVDMISGIVSGDFAKAGKGLENLGKGLLATSGVGYVYQYGAGIKDAFNRGYENELNPVQAKASEKSGNSELENYLSQFGDLGNGAANAGLALTELSDEAKEMAKRMKDVYATYQNFGELSDMLMNRKLMYEEPRKQMFQDVSSAITEIKQLLSLFNIQRATGLQFESLKGFDEEVLRTYLNRFMQDEDLLKQEEAMSRGLEAITGGGKSVTNITIQKAQVAENLDMNFETFEEGVTGMEDELEAMLARVLNNFNRTAAQ